MMESLRMSFSTLVIRFVFSDGEFKFFIVTLVSLLQSCIFSSTLNYMYNVFVFVTLCDFVICLFGFWILDFWLLYFFNSEFVKVWILVTVLAKFTKLYFSNSEFIKVSSLSYVWILVTVLAKFKSIVWHNLSMKPTNLGFNL